jgi:hypothetical protein
VKLPNKIATGLNSWLSFEQMCGRKSLFSESYLAYPIAQLLATEFGAGLVSEYKHPVLAPLKCTSGDKPRLDFAVLQNDGKVELAVETKWLSSSKTLHKDIIKDLVRLELVRHHQGCEAWLIVAGPANSFESLVNCDKFAPYPNKYKSNPLLPHGKTRQGILRLDPVSKYRKELISSALESFGGIEMSQVLHLTRFGPFPEAPKNNACVVYLWRLNHTGPRGRFVPPTVPKEPKTERKTKIAKEA